MTKHMYNKQIKIKTPQNTKHIIIKTDVLLIKRNHGLAIITLASLFNIYLTTY